MTQVSTIGTRRRLTDHERSYLLALLKGACHSDAQLAGLVGATPRTIASWRRQHPCFVQQWTHDSRGRLFTPCWRYGNQPNAERPGPRETPAERMARLRAERKVV